MLSGHPLSQPVGPLISQPPPPSSGPLPRAPTPSKDKDGKIYIKEEKKDDPKGKQEGVKPTMESQGPPPGGGPYAYTMHPGGYGIQHPYYAGFPNDPALLARANPVLMSPYYQLRLNLPPGHQRTAVSDPPQDLSAKPVSVTSKMSSTSLSTQVPPPGKSLDMLQHQVNRYNNVYNPHKIHELQERGVKSPQTSQPQSVPPLTVTSKPPAPVPISAGGSSQSKDTTIPLVRTSETDRSRSPPAQRHVHTHHHTHVGLTYPPYPLPLGQYPPPGGK